MALRRRPPPGTRRRPHRLSPPGGLAQRHRLPPPHRPPKPDRPPPSHRPPSRHRPPPWLLRRLLRRLRHRIRVRPGGHDRGAVTVEAALALGSLALVTALAVAAVAAVGASIRCTDAARELARLAARGEPDRGRAVAARLAPPGARIVLTVRGDEATANVTVAPVPALPVRVSGRAVAVLEPGVPASPAPAGPDGAPP